MLIIPAIDLRNGRVVRLWQGDFERETTYSESPTDMMCHWQRQGAKLVHVVDLDGARLGVPKNIAALKRMLDVAQVPVQFGGGLRDFKTIASILELGVSRVVIGTQASNHSLMKGLTQQFSERIAVALDVRGDKIQTHGWQSQKAKETPKTFCRLLEEFGVKTVVVTDTARDGTLEGPNVDLLKQVLDANKLDVIMSGGISDFEDLKQLSRIRNKHFIGVIVGRALYEQRFKLSEAIERFQGGTS